MRNGKEHRILTDVETVFDASPVTFPANPDTTVAKRSFDASREEIQADPAEEPETEQINTFNSALAELEIFEFEMQLTNEQ